MNGAVPLSREELRRRLSPPHRFLQVCHDKKLVKDEKFKEGLRFVASLKDCIKKKDVRKGSILHADAAKKGLLQKNLYIATTLISMYSRCGQLEKAQNVMEELPLRNVIAWNALIAGYTQQGKPYHALYCFKLMENEGLDPNRVTFICILTACGCIGAIDEVEKIHFVVLSRGLLDKDIVLGTTLVDMYSKWGLHEEAFRVLEKLTLRNIVSWNALISGYVQEKHFHEAIACFETIQDDVVSPNEVTFICILKACGEIRDVDKGKEVHLDIERKGLRWKDVVLGTALVNMYAKCGLFAEARRMLEELPFRNVVSWSSLIGGHVQQGQYHEALSCFEEMKNEHISPNVITLTCLLKACGKTKAIEKGKQIHDEIVRKGLLHKDLMLGNALVEMYAQIGMLEKAEQVLEELPIRNVSSWFVLMSGYNQQGRDDEVIFCFERMLSERISPNAIAFICILQACGSIGAIDKGEQIHEDIVNRGLIEKDMVLGTALVDMYAKCGDLEKSKKVLESLPVRDTISWNALIAGYIQEGKDHEALNCFRWMQDENLSPDEVTFICVLQVCGNTRAFAMGKKVHEEILNRGFLGKGIALDTALVDMYAKCGVLEKAQELLEGTPFRNNISWNALISGYAQEGLYHKALKCFEQMQCEGVPPTAVTFICILKACGCKGALDKGKHIHDEIVSRGLFEKDNNLGIALVDMYAKCGDLARARQVLNELPDRNIVSWSALIAGYVQQGQGHEALKCYEQMLSEGLYPNIVTLICNLKACGSIGATEMGRNVHDQIVCRGLLEDDTLGNALINMYAKCGELAKAQQVLQELLVRDVVSWNALISGFAHQGQGHEAIRCLQMMQSEGLSPDKITFLCVLNACSHSGLFQEAQMLFGSMSVNNCITPNLEHHICMVVVFGSSGYFDKAMSVIESIPSSDYVSIWLALLDACRRWGNVSLGKLVFNELVQLDNRCSPSYVLMADLFAMTGMTEDAYKINAMRL